MNESVDSSGTNSLEVADFDAIESLEAAAREAGWDLEYRQLQSGRLAASVASQELDGVVIVHERGSHGMEVVGVTAPDVVSVTVALRGIVMLNGRSMSNCPVVVPPNCEVVHHSSASAEILTLVIPTDEFSALLGPGARRAVLDGGVDPAVRLDPDWSRRATALLGAPAPGCAGALVQEVLRALDEEQGADEPFEARPDLELMDRVRAYIDGNLRAQIRMATLCRHAGVSLRTLERLFRATAQTTPTGYIGWRRLHNARKALRDPQRTHQTIARIASDEGFSHQGRFAVAYRAAFGETPSAARGRVRASR